MSHKLFELDVRLREIEPPIWRAIEVPGSASLEEVHFAIQVAMGWTNSHLHQFEIGDKLYGMADVDGGEDVEYDRAYRLQDVASEGDTFLYEYDFGDGWEHDVTVTKVTTVSKAPAPRCIEGARACPPEDCGGAGGYERLLEALADPDHDDHDELAAWANGFEPDNFALPDSGLALRKEMQRLQVLAEGDDGDDELDAAIPPGLELPRPLVEAVLALEPIQRAALAAVISGSLADELDAAYRSLDQLTVAQTPPKRRARSR